MHILERFEESLIVPVVVLDKEESAIPTALALLAGGVDVMEITFRTDAAPNAIRAVSQNCPKILVGAGTILNLEQCKLAVEMGARFIVCPGLHLPVVEWCISNHIPVIPGCVTPTEIQEALNHGLPIIKFFPSDIYGGIRAMKALSAPFGSVKFLPTGGIHTDTIKESLDAPFIPAVGGSWICPRSEIQKGNFEKITRLCMEARNAAKGK